MSLQNRLSDTEWSTVLYSLVWIFNAVAGADGNIDKRENEGMKRVRKCADKLNNELAKEIITELNNKWHIYLRQALSDNRGYMRGIMEVVQIVDVKFPKDISVGFKKILLAVGFYIGNISEDSSGKRLSQEELAQIAKLAGMLKLSKEQMNFEPTVADIMAIFSSIPDSEVQSEEVAAKPSKAGPDAFV